MGKGFTASRLIKGKEPLLRRVVCEVRYRDGYLYLDHSGRLLKKLTRSPEWVVASMPVPAGTTVFHLAAGATLAFSHQAASVELDKSGSDESIDTVECEQYGKLAEDTLGFVLDELEVKEWTRIGYREFYYFSCDSKEETARWLTELGLCTVSPTLADAFEGRVDTAAFSIDLEGENCSYKIGLTGIERSAHIPVGDNTLAVRASALPKEQKDVLKTTLKKQRQRQINSAFAAVLDIDAYRMDPTELDIINLIGMGGSNLERFRMAIAAGNGKKGK